MDPNEIKEVSSADGHTETIQDVIAQQVRSAWQAIETLLEAPAGSLSLLGFQDDWTIVIKSNALIEGMVTLMLVNATDERLTPAFEVLPYGEPQSGKLVFARLLGLIDSEQQQFARKLLTLRNSVAHSPKALRFTFSEHIATLDKNQRTQLAKELQMLIPAEDRKPAGEILNADIKYHVLAATMRFLRSGAAAAINRRMDKMKAAEAQDKAARLDDVLAGINKLLAEHADN